jgi:uncharacterized membrane protein
MYGPLQLIVLSFDEAVLPLGVVNQLRRLRDDGVIRMVDSTFVAKDLHGDIVSIKGSTDYTPEETALLGTLAGALFGYGAAGEEGVELGAELGLLTTADGSIGLTEDDIDEIADRIPAGSSAVFLLIEHLWALGVKEAVVEANGTVVAQGFITPETIMRMGEEFAEEAEDLG